MDSVRVVKTSKLELRLLLKSCTVPVSFFSSTANTHRKHLPIASQACGSELIMHTIVQPLTSAEFAGIQRVFSPEEESGGGYDPAVD